MSFLANVIIVATLFLSTGCARFPPENGGFEFDPAIKIIGGGHDFGVIKGMEEVIEIEQTSLTNEQI